MKKVFFLMLITIASKSNFAQSNNNKTKVYIECTRDWLCDYDFLKTELSMVDFVRDRMLSDVHIQVNTQFTSNGGEQNTINFKGQNVFLNMNDTLKYFNNSVATDDDKRKIMVQYVKLGLIKYISHTNIASNIVITYTAPLIKDTSKKTEKDTWNNWVMSLGTSAFFNGDANYKTTSSNSYLNADRETDKTKTNIGISYNYKKNVFTISPTEKITVLNPKLSAYINYIKKVNEHFGYGVFTDYTKDVFSNYKDKITFTPKVEYNLFPYKKFNNQRVVIQYGLGVQHNNYNDTTIFFKTSETQFVHEISIINSFVKPWGSINAGVFYNSFLSDFHLYQLSFSGSVNWRIFKGFKFGIGGNYDLTRNLIQLPKSGATRDDVLTQRKQLNTAYNYFFGVGFSYQFGSKFSNFINPAFKGLSWSLNF